MNIAAEGLMLSGFGISMFFLDEDMDLDVRENLGYAFIACMGVALLVLLVSSMYSQVIGLCMLFKKIANRCRERSVVKPVIPVRYPNSTNFAEPANKDEEFKFEKKNNVEDTIMDDGNQAKRKVRY